MNNKACPFCGSKDIMIETPYVDRITGKKKVVPCCKAQKDNIAFRNARYSGDDVPELEDISKL